MIPLIFSADAKDCITTYRSEVSIKILLGFASDGYRAGLSWKSKLMPGGPGKDALCDKAWKDGFKQGLRDAYIQE